jgi:CheY-specific phosphatase CheX
MRSEPEFSEASSATPIIVNINCGEKYDIFIQFDRMLAETITQNLLGSPDTSANQDLSISSIKEIANMIGGSFMNNLDMPASAKLSIPEIVDPGFSEDLDQEKTVSDVIYIDDRPLKLTLAG